MATYYINADTGNDTTGDGSQGNPWLTLSKANSSSASGDIIFLQNSVNYYSALSNITFTNKEILGESTSGAVISNGYLGTSTTYFTANTNSYLNIKNITFTNISGSGSYRSVIVGSNSATVNIENCIFTGQFSQGIISRISGTATYNITSCLFYDFLSFIMFWYGDNMTFNLNNNVFHFTNNIGNLWDYAGYSGGSSIHFKNNIFLSELGDTVNFKRGGIGISTMISNCLSGSFTGYPTGIGNLINTDPLFIDPDNNNYNLSPSSPCIDAGTLI
jgi:hypothetical protein